ncbi:hypothetical protein F-VV57_0064 [Faustovirus]|nr:hypothetical protein F-VV57_0064 [Faustovirus]QJX73332.1 hypothetical protein F-VV63_0066 [Faustovirus]
MESICNEILDQIMGYCDMWSSYQLACTGRTWMAIFCTKLEYCARGEHMRLAQVLNNAKLPTGFAHVLANHYFKNLTAPPMVPVSNITYLVDNFITINNLRAMLSSNDECVDSTTLLNVKLSPEYKERNIGAIARILFHLLTSGHVAKVAAIVYLQRFTPDYARRVIFGIHCPKVMFWLHPSCHNYTMMDTMLDTNIELKHACNECMYGNFNYYNTALADKLQELCDVDSLDYHIAYAYKYINYW